MEQIGIIGGGVSGAGVLYHLITSIVARESEKVSSVKRIIHIFERDRAIGGGIAWSQDYCSDVQLFNLPAGAASIKPDDFGALLGWSAKKGKPLEFGAYPPRHVFGNYVIDLLAEMEALASNNNIEIKYFPSTEVTDVQYSSDNDTFDIQWSTISEGDIRKSILSQMNAIFLCTGPAALVKDVYPSIKNTPNYISNPWPYTNYANILPDATVAVVGTGLTGIDVVKQLHSQGHKGKVIFTSRRGYLPLVKASTFEPFRPLKVATRKAIEQIILSDGMYAEGLLVKYLDLIKLEMKGFYLDFEQEKAGEKSIDNNALATKFDKLFDAAMGVNGEPSVADVIAELKSQVKYGEKAYRSPVQDCMIALSIADIYRTMWNSLGEADRATYFKKYALLFQVYNNAMPLQSATAIQDYIQNDWMELKNGLLDIRPSNCTTAIKAYELCYPHETVEVDYVINAVGFTKHFAPTENMDKLYQNMLKNGLVECHRDGGLKCDFKTNRLLSENKKGLKLYGVGHLVSGTKLVTSNLFNCLADGQCAVKDYICSL